MIIAGDSHIFVFKKGCVLPEKNNEAVKVEWCGPLNYNYFAKKHPLAQKIIKHFQDEKDWKFLSIGNFDIFHIHESVQNGANKDLLFKSLAENYKNLFSKFNQDGKFGWLVFFQQIHNYSSEDGLKLIELSREYNEFMTEICHELKISVINPLKHMVDENGIIKKEFLDFDQAHIHPKFASLYFNEIKNLTGEILTDKSNDVNEIFGENYVASTLSMFFTFTPEIFCEIFFKALAIPDFIDDNEIIMVKSILAKLINERLADKGLTLRINYDDDFIGTGLLESLDLLEVYSLISEKLGIEIDVSINLYDLNTINKLGNHIFSNYRQKLTKRDFIISLRGNYDNENQRNIVLASEAKIAKMDINTYTALIQIAKVASGEKDEIGLISLWKAFYEAENKNYKLAIQLLQSSRDNKIKYPLKDGRVNHYMKKWFKLI